MREESTVQDPVIRMIGTRTVITRTNLPVGDYAANPYVGCTHGCIYCYARFMKRFTDHHEPWGAFLDVKQWEPVRSPGRYEGKGIFLGSVTDPYLPAIPRWVPVGPAGGIYQHQCGFDVRFAWPACGRLFGYHPKGHGPGAYPYQRL